MDIKTSIVFYILITIILFLVLRNSGIVVDLLLIYFSIHLANHIYHWTKDPFFERRLLSKLNEKAVIITGCDSGFGNQLARKLINKGVTVFAGCLFPEDEGAQELKAIGSKSLHVIRLDVTNDRQVNEALEYVKRTLGDKKLWAIVNNAGVADYGELELCPLKKVESIMNVNAIGTVRVTKAFLPLVRKARGRVVLVASMAGRDTLKAMIPYSMSKHAVVSLADGLRREMMKFGVTVHSIEPWMYRTKLNSGEVLQRQVKESWNQAPQDVTSDYGAEYLEDLLSTLATIDQGFNPESKISDVVDAMIDASIGVNPKLRYEMGIFWILKILTYLPTQWMDFVVNQKVHRTKQPPNN